MADPITDYFAQQVPLQPAEGRSPGGGYSIVTIKAAWNKLARELFYTLPNQLDRARVWRNKFDNAVAPPPAPK